MDFYIFTLEALKVSGRVRKDSKTIQENLLTRFDLDTENTFENHIVGFLVDIY